MDETAYRFVVRTSSIKALHLWVRVAGVAWFALVLVHLSGCGTQGRAGDAGAEAPHPAVKGGVLAVRLLEAPDPPAALSVEILDVSRVQAASWTARMQSSFPGRHADYLVGLPLPPGEYRIRALRDARKPPDDRESLLATAELAFTLRDGDLAYLGRVSLRAGAAGSELVLEDRYDEDTLVLRASAPVLRDTGIVRALATAAIPDASASSGARAASLPPSLDVDRVDAAGVAHMTPAARQAFARYLRLPLPRAFAASETGAHAVASGRDAVDNALRQCTRQAPGRSCRLVAVDQTLLAPPPCPAVAAADTRATPGPGCSTRQPLSR